MKFGVFDQNDFTGRDITLQYEERLRIIELYEKNGFYSYHMSEHHGTPLSTTPSPSVFLAAVSQRTSTLRFGPLVYLVPLYHPLRLAEEICMLDHLSGGRFEFGVGKGASPFEQAYLGVSPETAVPMYSEGLKYVLEALDTGKLNGKGDFWSFEDVELALRPVQQPHPPVWYAVQSPDSAVWPAQHGMNIVCAGPPEHVKTIADRYYSERGDDAEAALVGINRFIVVAPTDEEALAIARRAWPVFYSHFIKLWDRYGAKPGINLPPEFDPMIGAGTAIAGSPATVGAALGDHIEKSGVNFLSGTFVFGDMSFEEAEQTVNLFGAEVMPKLRELPGRAPAVAKVLAAE